MGTFIFAGLKTEIHKKIFVFVTTALDKLSIIVKMNHSNYDRGVMHDLWN